MLATQLDPPELGDARRSYHQAAEAGDTGAMTKLVSMNKKTTALRFLSGGLAARSGAFVRRLCQELAVECIFA
jgi:hypothetical protein